MGGLSVVLKNIKDIMERVEADFVYVGDLPMMYYGGRDDVMEVHVKIVKTMKNPNLLKSILIGNGYDVKDEEFQEMINGCGTLRFENKDAMVRVAMSVVADEFDGYLFRERMYVKIDGVSVPIASSESLIAFKLRTGDTFGLLDAQAIFRSQKGYLAMHKVERAMRMAGIAGEDYKALLEADG